VVLHSDHCAKKLLEWFDGMLEADEAYFKVSQNVLMLMSVIENVIFRSTMSHFSQVTCWTCPKSLTRRTLQRV